MTTASGSATPLLLAVVAAGLALVVAIGDIAGYIGAGMQAATAADAAALAAAPVTFDAFGTIRTPRLEAQAFAVANGASLVTCHCPVDRSWNPRTVEVIVERPVRLVLFGSRKVRAVGRAEFLPAELR